MKFTGLIVGFIYMLEAAASRRSPPDPAPEPEMHRCGIWDNEAEVSTGPVQEHGVAATNDNMYVIGGIPANYSQPIFHSRRDVTAYNFDSNSWSPVAEFPIGITHPNVAGVDGGIYVLGGLTDNGKDQYWNYTTACYVYRPETDRWDPLPQMPDREARGAAAVGVYGSKIILAGGLRSVNFSGGAPGGIQKSMKRVTSFDTRTFEWKTLRPLPEPRDHAGGAVIKSKFYVTGGRDSGRANVKNNTWSLNLKTWGADWVPKEDLPSPRAGFAVGTHFHRILIFGGEGNKEDPTGVFAESLMYNTRRDEWKRVMDLPKPRHGMGAVSFVRNTWIPGGGLMEGRARPDATTNKFTLDDVLPPPNGDPPGTFNASHLPDGCLV
ncbi:hypothetical protein FHL15_010275 [Xylaria flabelliformis]|uniref:Galactose oxidase n=1 Tax=Xylaria flabelliformis TaxID=2512241 RepID=A0A553HLM8_9PEZI|nr:hypothetical protein FHL15_010275 [Xylaria flabelliformis]